MFGLGWKSMALLCIAVWFITSREKPIYLVDFTTFEPPESWRLSSEQILQILKAQGCFTEESLSFMERMLKQSGVGPKTAWPPTITCCLKGKRRTEPQRARVKKQR